MSVTRVGRLFACVAMALAAAGCGGDTGGLKLVRVTGQVNAGSAPFANGQVQFVPKDPKFTGGSAITDDDGNYVLKHSSNRNGIEAGEYFVRFSLMKMPDGSELPDQSETNHPQTPIELGAVEWVVPEYSNMRSTKNPVTVEAGGGTFDFEIPELQSPGSKPIAGGTTKSRAKLRD